VPQPKPHVILIAYHFPPGPEIGGQRPFRFYKYLQRAGYPCHVITATRQPENGPANVIEVPDDLRAVWEGAAGTKLSFEAYKELLIRKLMFPGHIGFLWSRKAAARSREIIRDHRGEKFVVFSSYPPMGTIFAGLLLRLREKIPWIADFRDPISGVASELVPANARFWNDRLEALSFRFADAVVANAEGAAEVWRKRFPRAADKLQVIDNGFDPEDVPQARTIPQRTHRVIVHAGALYHGRNPNVILEALSRLRMQGAPEALSAQILLVGSVDHKAGLDRALFDEAQRDGWLELRASVPRSESQRILEEAEGLLLVQPQTSVQVPGKLFEYICIGRPILALVPKASAVEKILQQAAIPHVCIYPDDERVAADNKLLEFLRFPNSPTQSSDWFRSNFNAELQTARLAAIVEELAR
jgi:glycosyltransferase involved in cell wall biosynthesis